MRQTSQALLCRIPAEEDTSVPMSVVEVLQREKERLSIQTSLTDAKLKSKDSLLHVLSARVKDLEARLQQQVKLLEA